jgi:CBS-domain-containing membrane protein
MEDSAMFDYQPLSVQYLSGTILIFRPSQSKPVTLESSALDVRTDLRNNSAVVIEPYVSMEFANSYMIQCRVRSLLVLNHDHSLIGIITSTDILGDKPLCFVQERHVKHNEILVSDIMTPLDRLEAISILEVESARVGQIVANLRETGRQHILATENNGDGKSSVCGIFSFTQIERQLDAKISSTKIAGSFAEIEELLMAH